jgi:lysophospholipase L1-like esterase
MSENPHTIFDRFQKGIRPDVILVAVGVNDLGELFIVQSSAQLSGGVRAAGIDHQTIYQVSRRPISPPTREFSA